MYEKMVICVSVGIKENTYLILQKFLESYLTDISDELKEILLYFHFDYNYGAIFNELDKFNLVCKKIKEKYGVTILIGRQNKNGHHEVLNDFLYNEIKKINFYKKIEWVLFLDYDIYIEDNCWIKKIKHIIENNNLSAFGEIGSGGYDENIKSYFFPRINAWFLGVNLKDFIEMKSTMYRLWEGNFKENQLTLNNKYFFGDTCCFYFIDLIKNSKKFLEINLKDIGVYHERSISDKLNINSTIYDGNLYERYKSCDFFQKIIDKNENNYIDLKNKWRDIEGFFNEEEAECFNDIVSNFNNEVIIEIGSFYGRSAFSIVETCINNNNKIYCVDAFENETKDGHLPPKEIILNNLKKFGLQEIIHIVESYSTESFEKINEIPSVVFIDASHDYESVKNDILYWLPKIKYGGYICGHDYSESYHLGVKKACDEIFSELDGIRGTFWYKKVKNVSGIIITYNEDTWIRKPIIDLLRICDEVIVIDSFSNDKTKDICCEYKNVKFIQREFDDYNCQYNFGLDQSMYDWSFILDTDEQLSDSIIEDFKNIVNDARLNGFDSVGFIRHNYFYPNKYHGKDSHKFRLHKSNKKYMPKKIHTQVLVNNPYYLDDKYFINHIRSEKRANKSNNILQKYNIEEKYLKDLNIYNDYLKSYDIWKESDCNFEQSIKHYICAGSDDYFDFEKDAQGVIEKINSFYNIDQKEIIEYGCGVGRITKYLSKNCKNVIGIDISDNFLKLASQYCAECDNVRFINLKNPYFDMDYTKKVDCIIFHNVAQHIDKPFLWISLKNLSNLLKNNGNIYIHFSLFGSIYEDIVEKSAILNKYNYMRHEIYSKDELYNRISKAGLLINKEKIVDQEIFFLLEKKKCKKNIKILYPKGIELEITSRCNLRCVMCSQSWTDDSKKEDLPNYILEKIKEPLNYATSVSLHGIGEPLLANNFWDVVENINLNSHVSFHSNMLILSEKDAEKIVEGKIKLIDISLDAATEETYLKIRGGSFNKVLKNIQTIIRKKEEIGSIYPQLRMNMTLMKENIHEVCDFVLLAKKIGINTVHFWRMNEDWYPPKVENKNFIFIYNEQTLSNYKKLFNENITKARELAFENNINFVLDSKLFEGID